MDIDTAMIRAVGGAFAKEHHIESAARIRRRLKNIGYVIVPVEPTDEMIGMGCATLYPITNEEAVDIYKAMIVAAEQG